MNAFRAVPRKFFESITLGCDSVFAFHVALAVYRNIANIVKMRCGVGCFAGRPGSSFLVSQHWMWMFQDEKTKIKTCNSGHLPHATEEYTSPSRLTARQKKRFERSCPETARLKT